MRKFLLIVSLWFLTLPVNTIAQWTSDPSLNTRFTNASGNESGQKTISDGKGGTIIGWVDTRSGTSEIYVQRIDSEGITKWTANGIILTNGFMALNQFSMASDGSTGVVVAWTDSRNIGVSGYDIYAQRVDSSGNVMWTAGGIPVSNFTNNQTQPSIAYTDNSVAVSWTDQRGGGANSREVGIYAQKLNLDGTEVWAANGVVALDAAQAQNNSIIAHDGYGGVMIAMDDESNSWNPRVTVQRLNSAGSQLFSASGIQATNRAVSGPSQFLDDMVGDNAGNITLTFRDHLNSPNIEYVAQKITYMGSRNLGAGGLRLVSGSGFMGFSKIGCVNNSNFIVTFNHYDGVNFSARVQEVAAGSIMLPLTGLVLESSSSPIYTPEITADVTGAIISWRRGDNVYAQKVFSSSVLWTAGGVTVSNASGIMGTVKVTSDGAGGATVIFSEHRSLGTNTDLYAQKLDVNGALVSAIPPPPASPALQTPANLAEAVSLTPALVWSSVSGADGYLLVAATDTSFTNIVANTSLLTDTSYLFGPAILDYYTTYYWKVRTVDGTDTSNYSARFSFRTLMHRPTPSSPDDGSVFNSLTPELVWYHSPGATSYEINLATDVSFTNMVLTHTQSAADSFYTVTTPLNNYTDYFFRIRAINAHETTPWSAVFNFLTLIATPAPASPANAAVAVPVSPVLAWSASAGASSYTLEVATDTGFTNIVRSFSGLTDTSHTVTPQLNSYTVYYWRVKAHQGSDATVFSSRFSFETEIASPVLVSPANTAAGISIHPNLVWRSVAGATGYSLQLSANAGFSTLIHDTTLTDTSFTVSEILANNTLHYWRVKAHNAVDTSDYSGRNFRTVNEVIAYLSHPVSNATVYTLNPVAYWYLLVSPTGISYDVQYSTDNTFPAALTTTLDAGSAMYDTLSGLLPGTHYFWRVRTKNNSALISYSATGEFTTYGNVSVLPNPTYPNGGATVYTLSPTLYWYLGVSAFGYTYDIRYKESSSGTWSAPVAAGTALSYQLSGLQHGTSYDWQVRALNGVDTSAWSSIQTFQTVANTSSTPVVPVISYPAGGVTVYSLTPVLNWYIMSVNSGLTYEMELRTDNSFTGIATANGINALYFQTSTLLPGTTYYYKVRSSNGSAYSAWSATESFTTYGITGQLTPVLSYPVGGEMVYTSTAQLSWYVLGSAANITYELQINANDTSFTTTIPVSGTTYSAASLLPGTTYFWRVRANNGIAYSAWTPAVSFTVTGSTGTLIPILSWPVGGAAQTTTAELFWYVNGYSPTISYQVQYSTESDFSNPVTVSSSTASAQLTGLTAGVTYYWRVRSNNGTAWSSYSSAESFVTLAGSMAVRPIGGSPSNNVLINTNSAQLSWYLPTPAAGLHYELQYSASGDFTDAVTVQNLNQMNYTAASLPAGTTVHWRVRSKTPEGVYSNYSQPQRFIPASPTSAGDESDMPAEFELAQNYPNPFNPSTVISFTIPQEVYVTVKIYDMLGREVNTIVSDFRKAGIHRVQWNGDNYTGNTVSAGTYLYRITAGEFVETRKMIFLK